MAGLTKQEQAKKGPRKASLHTEPVHDLVPMVDWEEQERIRASLKGKYIEPFPHRTKTSYTPERGAELCVMRRMGKSMRVVGKESGVSLTAIRNWLADQPEFSQEWNDAYTEYMTDVAEELVPMAENLVKGLMKDGRRLSSRQEGRYMRAAAFLAEQVKFAAPRRVPGLYGDSDSGMELVLVQPVIPERNVTQDLPRAEAWRREVEDAEASVPDSGGPDFGTGDDGGGPGVQEPGCVGTQDGDGRPGDVGRDEGSRGGPPEPTEPVKDEGD